MTSFLIMSFRYFIIDDKKYECTKNGGPEMIRKTARKIGEKNEVQIENEFLAKVKNSHFIDTYKESFPYQYLTDKIPKLVASDAASLGRMLAHVFEFEMPREVYRRMLTTIYWFNQNWYLISSILSKHQIIGIHSKWGKIHFDAPPTFINLPMIVVPIKGSYRQFP